MTKTPTLTAYRDWLRVSIDRLDTEYDHPEPHEACWETSSDIALEAGNAAARLGFFELHQKSLAFAGMTDPMAAKTFLAECLAGSEPKETLKPPALLLSVEDVAGMIGVSPSHVYRLADGGKMPRPVNVGSLVRWSRADIENWVSNGCKPVRR